MLLCECDRVLSAFSLLLSLNVCTVSPPNTSLYQGLSSPGLSAYPHSRSLSLSFFTFPSTKGSPRLRKIFFLLHCSQFFRLFFPLSLFALLVFLSPRYFKKMKFFSFFSLFAPMLLFIVNNFFFSLSLSLLTSPRTSEFFSVTNDTRSKLCTKKMCKHRILKEEEKSKEKWAKYKLSCQEKKYKRGKTPIIEWWEKFFV